MQGPAELLPVSSSGHVALVPHLLGWDARSGPPPGGGYAALPPHLRKTFEVALHAASRARGITRDAAASLALRAAVPVTGAGSPHTGSRSGPAGLWRGR